MPRTRSDDIEFREHSGFKGSIDDSFVNDEKIPLNFLKDTTNLTPFRVANALTFPPGHSVVFGQTAASGRVAVPDATAFNLSGFVPVDMQFFSVNRDKKDITLLIYKNGSGVVRMFIYPFFNPSESYSNYNPNYTANSWINAWQELTERYDIAMDALISNFSVQVDAAFPSLPNDYLNGFFVVNTFGDRMNPYNYITDWDLATRTMTLKAQVGPAGATAWGGASGTNADVLTIVRFPVCYNYNASTINMAGDGNDFKGLPTTFTFKDSSLRMGCGKDNRPLILEFIETRKYFLGGTTFDEENGDMSYDGFWFDFQSIPQVLSKSVVSAFQAYSTGGGASLIYLYDTAGQITLSLIDPGAVPKISILYSGSNTITLQFTGLPFAFPAPVYTTPLSSVMRIAWNIAANGGLDTILLANHMQATFNATFGTGVFTVTDGGVLGNLNGGPVQKVWCFSAGGVLGIEAGGNMVARNLFLGTEVEVITSTVGATVDRWKFILTAIIDHRSQIVIAHGTHDPTGTTKGFTVNFNPWFSRRLTNLQLWNKKHDRVDTTGTNVTPIVGMQAEYPYFVWDRSAEINNLPGFSIYSCNEFARGADGQSPFKIQSTITKNAGVNCYTYDRTNGKWFVRFAQFYTGLGTDGEDIVFVAGANRTIDRDTTMNYTSIVFIGQTNGRFFISGVKNVVEKDPYTNDDAVIPNLYAVGVSEYDTFNKDSSLDAAPGDKDYIQTIASYSGYLLLIKKHNVYPMEVRTADDDLDYRILDTLLGRGSAQSSNVCVTPHGVVMAATDTIWLLTPDRVRPILNYSNGRVKLYRDALANNTLGSVQMAYYDAYDELIVILNQVSDLPGESTTRFFVYNFGAELWTNYEYNGSATSGCAPTLVRSDGNGILYFLNYISSTKWNIFTFNENIVQTANVATDVADTYPTFVFETHKTPYAGRVHDFLLEAATLTYDIQSSANAVRTLTVTTKREKVTDNVQVYNATEAVNTFAEDMTLEMMPAMIHASSVLGFKITNTGSSLAKIIIKSLYVWGTAIKKFKTTTNLG